MPIDAYLAQIIQPLVSHPDEVQISSSSDDMGVLLTIKLHKEDMGAVIGRAGETAKCIRTLVRIAGLKQNARVSIKILEPEGSRFRKPKAEQSDKELLAA